METENSLSFAVACAADTEQLVALRIEAMRESLERIGRFDPERAREHFLRTFEPTKTRHILLDGERIGFLVVKHELEYLLLNHLYIHPRFQGRGFGTFALEDVCAEAQRCRLPIRLGALRDSTANEFYLRHGFLKIAEEEFDIYYMRDWQLPFA